MEWPGTIVPFEPRVYSAIHDEAFASSSSWWREWRPARRQPSRSFDRGRRIVQ